MIIIDKTKRIIFLCSMLDEFLLSLVTEPNSAAAVFSGIDNATALLCMAEVNKFKNEISGLGNDNYLSDLPEQYIILLNMFLDSALTLLNNFSKRPSLLQDFHGDNGLFEKLLQMLSVIKANINLGRESASYDKWDYTWLSNTARELFSIENYFERTLENKSNQSLFNSIENVSNSKISNIKSLIDERVYTVDKKIQTMDEIFENEKNKARADFKKFNSEADALLNDYHQRLESIKITEDETKLLYDSAVNRAREIINLASREGMAAAFQKRYEQLKRPAYGWGVLFVVLLVALSFSGWYFIEFLFSSNAVDIKQLLFRVTTSLPLVWLAWFSAKQYNHVSKLREDYAYKVAVAMAYHGYKDEACEIDNEMTGRLLENIILHFASNPVRLYGNDNSATIVEALVKNNKVADVINAVRGVK